MTNNGRDPKSGSRPESGETRKWQNSRPESGKSGKIDEETKTYVEMVCTKLRNIKPLVLKAYRTKNNLSKEQRKSFSKLAKLTEERKIVICRADKDGKIVILNYDDYDAIMIRELQQFEKLDVSVDGSDTYLEKVRKYCNELVVKVHAIGELKDELLPPITGMKCKNNAYRKVNGASAKYFRCGFYEVFSDKTKIIFNGYAMIDVQKFNFACFLGSASLSER